MIYLLFLSTGVARIKAGNQEGGGGDGRSGEAFDDFSLCMITT